MTLIAAIVTVLLLQALPPEPGTVLERASPYVHPAGGFALTLPQGWRYFPLEDGSGIALLHDSSDARIEAFAVAAEPSGVPGLPDDTVDALILRLDGPGFRRGARVRVPLVVTGESAGDRVQAGETDGLSYTGSNTQRRWAGVAATRCGADIIVTLDAAQAGYEPLGTVFDDLAQSWALLLGGGEDFPCDGR